MKKIETIKRLIAVHRCDLRVPGTGLTGVIGNKETADIHTGRLGLMDWRAQSLNVRLTIKTSRQVGMGVPCALMEMYQP